MNVLFLSLSGVETFKSRGIYTDLLRQFIAGGHTVYWVSPAMNDVKKSYLIEEDSNFILKVKTDRITKSNSSIKKGLAMLLIKHQFIDGIKCFFAGVKFDLVLYPTPPITLDGVVCYIKKRDNAKTYLLLKDIFPQNSVDLGMLSKTGIKGLIYRYFRNKEKHLYGLSDKIGCMSQANVDYVLKHNPDVPPDKVEICPNSVEPIDMRVSAEEKIEIRKKYDLPVDKKIFVYGGNLGRPQDVPFIVECLKACADVDDAYFVIAGSGTDRHYLADYVEAEHPSHIKLYGYLPKDEYDKMIASCDVGLIFLDHRFTIPNFPCRLLSYMQAGLLVLACTDKNTDVGRVAVDGGFGWWCESDSPVKCVDKIKYISGSDLQKFGARSYDYLIENYTAQTGYDIIMKSLE